MLKPLQAESAIHSQAPRLLLPTALPQGGTPHSGNRTFTGQSHGHAMSSGAVPGEYVTVWMEAFMAWEVTA